TKADDTGRGSRSFEVRLDLRCERDADARNGGDLLDGRVLDPLDRAEHAQEGRPAARADARQVVELRADRRLAPEVAVIGDREPVGLVPDPLDEIERL